MRGLVFVSTLLAGSFVTANAFAQVNCYGPNCQILQQQPVVLYQPVYGYPAVQRAVVWKPQLVEQHGYYVYRPLRPGLFGRPRGYWQWVPAVQPAPSRVPTPQPGK